MIEFYTEDRGLMNIPTDSLPSSLSIFSISMCETLESILDIAYFKPLIILVTKEKLLYARTSETKVIVDYL